MSQKRGKKISWNSRSLETALSAWWLLAGAAKFNNLLLQRIQILKALSYLGDEKINRIYPNENYFLSRNLSLQEKKKKTLSCIPLENPCSQKGPDLPSFCHTRTLYWGVFSNTWASDHNYRSSCLKFTNTDVTCKSEKGKKNLPVECQMKSGRWKMPWL